MTTVPDPLQDDPPDRPGAAAVPPAGAGADPGGLQVIAQRRGRWCVLVLAGELDLATVPRLDDALSRAVAADSPPRVALELSGLRFCDSSGLNAFVRGWRRAAASGGEFLLISPTQQTADYLQITGLDQHLTITATLPE